MSKWKDSTIEFERELVKIEYHALPPPPLWMNKELLNFSYVLNGWLWFWNGCTGTVNTLLRIKHKNSCFLESTTRLQPTRRWCRPSARTTRHSPSTRSLRLGCGWNKVITKFSALNKKKIVNIILKRGRRYFLV